MKIIYTIISARHRIACALFVFILSGFSNRGFAQVPRPDHVVVCIMENHPYTGLQANNSIYANAAAPHINALINDSGSASFTSMHAITHPSQPNYIEMFSGNNQGVTTDNMPTNYPFTTPNLGRELIDASFTFVTYSEDLPHTGYDSSDYNAYARKHNPVTNWVGTGTNQVPALCNQPLTSFPTSTGYDSLPTVCYVVPNRDNDMHNGTDPARITTGDTWMYDHLNAYIQWAKTHNSLFILTFDEDDGLGTPVLSNRIVTVFSGEMVKTGQYSENINHHTVLRTIEEMYGTGHAGQAAFELPITDVWKIPSAVHNLSSDKSAWQVYPNPVSSRLNFRNDQIAHSVVEVSIMDALGRVVSRAQIINENTVSINTSTLPAGIYCYTLASEGALIQAGRLIVE